MDELSLTFKALSDRTRRAILAKLSKGPASVSQLVDLFNISGPAVTKHLKVLERAKLITRSRDAQWRPCALNGAPLKKAKDWVEQYRQFWEESFDRLGEYLEKINLNKQQTRKKTKHGNIKKV